MTTPQLHIWNTLDGAFYAPFSLEASTWKALARPVVALIVSSILLVVVNYFQLNATVQLITYLPIWASAAWFACDFQRHLLLGAAGCKSESGKWRSYGVYLLVLIAVCVLLALFLGILLYMVLPAMVWFSMALISQNPWLAFGTVVLLVLVIGVASYPLVRFAMILPAVSVGHSIAAKRIWRLSHGRGLRLLALLIFIPGSINGLLYFVFDVYSSELWATILASLLDTYFVLLYLSILALSYRELSNLQLPTMPRSKTVSEKIFNSRVLWPSVSILLVSLSFAAVLDAVYKVGPGENVIISGLDKTERIESDPGFNVKIPFLEKAQRISKEDSYKTEGAGQFLTITKDSLSLKYDAYWHVVNTDAFVRTTAGQYRHVDMRLEQLLHHELRNQLIGLKQEEVQSLKSGGKKKFNIKDEPRGESSLAGVLNDINSIVTELGIEMTDWSLETDHQP